jgi:hypothetical protein
LSVGDNLKSSLQRIGNIGDIVKIGKSKLSPQDLATEYYLWAESILRAMVDSALAGNLKAVFLLNRPFLEASYKGTWLCVVDPDRLPDADIDDTPLEDLAAQIDSVIAKRFEAWGQTADRSDLERFLKFLKSGVLASLASEGKVKPSTVIQRLHNDVHSSIHSIEYYKSIPDGQLSHSAREICWVAWQPFLLNLRSCLSKRFPDGKITSANISDIFESSLAVGIARLKPDYLLHG